MKNILPLAAALAFAGAAPQPPTRWACTTLNATAIGRSTTYTRLNCTSSPVPVFGAAGPLIINVIEAPLGAPGVRLLPIATAPPAGAAPSAAQLMPLDRIVAATPACVGAVNGGYFWRLDVGSFFDGVCLFKLRGDAEKRAAAASPNNGIADGAIVSNGVLLGSNCDCAGNSRPAVLSINGTASRVDVLHRGDAPPAGLALDAISAGPNLVTTNSSGTFVDIPSDDDNIGNILEHSSNTAVGLRADGTAVLVTIDGHDGCPPLNPTCGANAFTFAYLMRDYFNCTTALNMDQGGSTTMWVRGAPGNGVVSNPGAGARNIYGGLCVVEE